MQLTIEKAIEVSEERGHWVKAYRPMRIWQQERVVVRNHAAAISDILDTKFNERILWLRLEGAFYQYALLAPPAHSELSAVGRAIVDASPDLRGVVQVTAGTPGTRSWPHIGSLFRYVKQTLWSNRYAQVPISDDTIFYVWPALEELVA